ncbi:putative GTP diphosphokinase RSH2, chloroplastic [Drosera capensis]
MHSCYYSPNTTTMLEHKSTSLILKIHPFRPRFRSTIDSIPHRFSVSASIGALAVSANAIAAAASGASAAHGAVTSTITQVAVTAVAIASGACLSTKVDFLWPKLEEQPSSMIIDGVDVTGFPIFTDSQVQKAISFARRAHHGQLRKTGEAYLTHCIHTGRILAALVPSVGNRAVETVVAGILHDVIDDTSECILSVRKEFGDDVAKLVAGVSRLSYVNQLLRRHRRINASHSSLSPQEANDLRVMLLGMVDDPRVVLIKLADRLHNMRTIYALPLPKAQAVAHETLIIWCSLASRLGLWALKAELEDLCFAILQPRMFREMKAELASMWSSCGRLGNLGHLSSKGSLFNVFDKDASCTNGVPMDEPSMQDLLQAVIPFDLLLDRRKRSLLVNSLTKSSNRETIPKVVRDAGIALASLAICEEMLERELLISTSYVPGMEVTLCSRLKSLYSIYSKMKRKDIGISKVYDARALRVIIGDKDGTLHGPAVGCCYNVLEIVHRLWSPIDGELDDYIVNPKPSGYQSLHTAVQGPDNLPLEVQIRTQRMHDYAEHGLAAHWLYKETENKSLVMGTSDTAPVKTSSEIPGELEDHNAVNDDIFRKYRSLRAGCPVLRVQGSHLLAAVIIRVDNDGKELLVAVNFGSVASEAVAERRTTLQLKRWEAYARFYKKVCDQWWFEQGHGDWSTCLEKYILCRDGIYHKQDQFDRLLPTFIQVIQLTEEEGCEYWDVVSAVFEGKDVESVKTDCEEYQKPKPNNVNSTSAEANVTHKVRLLRTMLQWEEELCSEVAINRSYSSTRFLNRASTLDLGEVAIVLWPHGEIMRFRAGSTAGDAARRAGRGGKLVLVNGQLVQPSTRLRDGDVVEVRL